MPVSIICQQCGRAFKVKPYRAATKRFCSLPCRNIAMRVYSWNKGKTGVYSEASLEKMRESGRQRNGGAGNPAWNGGRRIDRNGYVLIHCPDHPAAVNSYVREHRVVMERTLARLLEPHEVVHHINGIKDDNRPENLHLFGSNSAHMQHHPHSEKPTNNATQRRCHRCHEIKPLTDQFFSKSKQGKYGFGYLCNQCRYEKYLERTPNRKRRKRHSRK